MRIRPETAGSRGIGSYFSKRGSAIQTAAGIVLNEPEDIEALQRPIRKDAVHRIPLINAFVFPLFDVQTQWSAFRGESRANAGFRRSIFCLRSGQNSDARLLAKPTPSVRDPSANPRTPVLSRHGYHWFER